MTRLARVLTVLIASPMDVAAHRDALERGVALWNRGPLARFLGVTLEVLRWEHDAVPMLGSGDAQQVINQQLAEDADIVVAMFHGRLGRSTGRHPSGTAEEIAVGVGRGVPVHVYVDRSSLPEGHEPEQYEKLQNYLKKLEPQGLLAAFEGQPQLLELVRQALEHDITQLLKKLPAPLPTTSGSLRDRLNEAADLVLTAEVYAPGASFDGYGPAAIETFERRRDQLLELAAPWFDAVIEVARGDDEDAYELLLELLDELAVNPYASGLTALIDQTRFVPAVAFNVAGVVACWAGRDKLVGSLLFAERTVTEPARGAVPMAYGFRPHTATYRGRRDSKQLHDDLAELLSGVLTAGTFHRAWEAWAFLCAIANVHFRTAQIPADSSWPYLQVKDLHLGGGLTTHGGAGSSPARQARRCSPDAAERVLWWLARALHRSRDDV